LYFWPLYLLSVLTFGLFLPIVLPWRCVPFSCPIPTPIPGHRIIILKSRIDGRHIGFQDNVLWDSIQCTDKSSTEPKVVTLYLGLWRRLIEFIIITCVNGRWDNRFCPLSRKVGLSQIKTQFQRPLDHMRNMVRPSGARSYQLYSDSPDTAYLCVFLLVLIIRSDFCKQNLI
jgi:hypothetical protein